MIYPIVRMYANEQDAVRAYTRLQACGLASELINLVTPARASSENAAVAAIAAGLVLKAHARVYAQGILRGNSLVSVSAPFGTGRTYEAMLDEFNPVDSGLTEDHGGPVWDEAAPFSSAFGMPVLSAPSRYSFLGLPAISRAGATTSSSFGLPELARSDFALFGTPGLSRNPAPFSSILKLRVIL
jgi:hypothetical protein